MWVRPAESRQRDFIRRCIADSRGYASGAFNDLRMAVLLRQLGPDQRKVFVACVPAAPGSRDLVGVTFMEFAGDLSWAIAPEHRKKGYGTRMVTLVAYPYHVARIDASDVASAKIAQRTGFDLIEDGSIQKWRGDRVVAYGPDL
jgi:hypothetical protein